jgi:hypothetical protein
MKSSVPARKMLINQIRLDLLTLHTTIDGLRGIGKSSGAPFSFLFAKRPYRINYENATRDALSITVPPLDLRVLPVCLKNDNNFWNGAWNQRYAGYIGTPHFSEVAWNKFLPFKVELPVKILPAPASGEIVWSRLEPQVHLWSCGWAISIQLVAKGSLELEQFATLMRTAASEAFVYNIGQDSQKGTMTSILQSLSDCVQQRIYNPVFSNLATPPVTEKFGPFFMISIRMAEPEPLNVANLDEQSARLIYFATSGDPTWKSYKIQNIREGFKIIDTHPGSFIFADRMARLFWFPYLTNRKLACYVENTKAATVMMIRLAEFIRLLVQQQTGPTLRANYPLRELFQSALGNLERFPSFYRNTNLKRLAKDLGIDQLVAKGKALLS